MNWIERKARESSLKRMLAMAAVVVAIIVLIMMQMRYLTNYFKGAYAIKPVELGAVTDVEKLERYWVTLDADVIHETGFEEITVRKKHGVERSRSVSAAYFVARIGKRLLLVKAHGDTPVKSLHGFLKLIVSKADVAFFNSPEAQKVKPAFYPMLLDTEDFKTDGDLWLSVAGLLLVAALIYGVIAFLRFRNPQSHPAVKFANATGKADQLSASIEASINSGQVAKLGNHIITDDHIVNSSMLNFGLSSLDGVIWCYQQVVQKKVYYVIPAGKTYSLSINTGTSTLLINGPEFAVEAAIHHINARRPWVILGHSDELETNYKKRRKEMIAWVASRKQEIQAEPAQSPGSVSLAKGT